MTFWARVGGLVLSASVVACGSQWARSPAPSEPVPDVAASSGGGGAATADTGRFPTEDEGDARTRAKRGFYTQVARELGIERGLPVDEQRGTGGSGISAGEKRLCVEALDSREPVTLVSGIIRFRTQGLVVVEVPGTGPVKLRTDDVTCAVQSGKALPSLSLSEGTEARVAYVGEGEEATARVIRAEPMRPQR
jgi:hypothetical protein